MTSICFYLHIHQPIRLKKYSLFAGSTRASEREGAGSSLREAYFDNELNMRFFKQVAEKSYLPTNALLKKLVEEHGGAFKFSLSLSGVFIEQCEEFGLGEKVLQSFSELIDSGAVEVVGETFYHSLASLFFDSTEFEEQVELHEKKLREVFGSRVALKAFRNTELLYNNFIAKKVFEMGFNAMLSEGIERVLEWRSPNYVYSAKDSKLKVLLRNYKLSDDIGFRFSARDWSEWPLTAEKYASWLAACSGQCVNLFMDYETFGEHHWRESGIFEFLARFPQEVLNYSHLDFKTISEVVEENPEVGEIDVPTDLSWADLERDSSAWLGNKMQWAFFHELQKTGELVKQLGDPELTHVWRLLQTSDHFMYMCNKSWADGDVHKHFCPRKEWKPFENYVNSMNVLIDFKNFLENAVKEVKEKREKGVRNELKRTGTTSAGSARCA